MTAPRVVVRMPNWLGDVVMALPALRALREHFQAGWIGVAAPAALSPLLEVVPDADAVLPLARRGGWRRTLGDPEDVERLAGASATVCILLTNSFGSALAVRRAGVPERWGYARGGRSWLLTRAVPCTTPGDAAARHHSQYYLRLVQALGAVPPKTAPLPLSVPERLRADARTLLAAHGWREGELAVGLAPGAAYGAAKQWPPDRVAAFVSRLLRETPARCVLVGASSDAPAARAVESSLDAARMPTGAGSRVVNLVGATTLGELLGVMSWCRAFVSNDSGAMHLAAAAGVPVTAVFGPTDEIATAPLGPHTIVSEPVWCRPCLLRECPLDHRCMTSIGADRVFESVHRHLDAAPAAGAR